MLALLWKTVLEILIFLNNISKIEKKVMFSKNAVRKIGDY